MNSRQNILAAVRGAKLPATTLPDLQGPWTTYSDPQAQFIQVLEAVGGRALKIADGDSIEAGLQQLEVYREATRIWSLVPGVESGGGDWDRVTDPHAFESLECCVVPGEFAVAENGAVWLTHQAIAQRAALFVTQHLMLVVPADQIVQNMHAAYARISFEHAQFGIFISGPSKTADIEQSLVIGAHGARSLTVLLMDGAVGQ